jgi:hypothetical protein
MAMKNKDGQTPLEWMKELFFDTNCDECGKDENFHTVIYVEGNFFARCNEPYREEA